MVLWLFICIAILTRNIVEMASNGAKESACASMFPAHYANKQQSAPPYELSVSSTRYNSSGNITVTIKSNDLKGFKGFLCQTRKDLEEYVTYGKLTPAGNVRMTNNCEKAASLTQAGPNRKSTVSFIWTPPTFDSGDITVLCTIVQQFDIFWTNVTSSKIIFSDYTGAFSTESTRPNLTSTNSILISSSTLTSNISSSVQSSTSSDNSSESTVTSSSTESSFNTTSTSESISNTTYSEVKSTSKGLTVSSGKASIFQLYQTIFYTFCLLRHVL